MELRIGAAEPVAHRTLQQDGACETVQVFWISERAVGRWTAVRPDRHLLVLILK